MHFSTRSKVIMGAMLERASVTKDQNLKLPLFIDYVTSYLNEELLICKRSPCTIKAVVSTLSKFIRYFRKVIGVEVDKFRLSDCTSDFVREWLDYEMREHKVSAATRNLRLSHLRSYVLYATDRCPLASYIYLQLTYIPELRVTQQIKTILSEAQITAIIRAGLSTEKGKRNSLILLLLYECALRASELVELKIEDVIIHGDKKLVHVFGKGKRHRNIVIKQETAELLKSYLNEFHKNSKQDSPLFYSIRQGQASALTVKSVEYLVKQAADIARRTLPDLPLRVHPHTFRRSKATALYRAGTPIELVSAFLGHESIETTTIYATPSEEQLRNALDKCDFPAEWKNTQAKYKEEEFEKMIAACGLTP